jgi:hypothetical protein
MTAEARRALLEQRSIRVGMSWAASCRRDLLAARRAVAGGWPGTLSEARARVFELIPADERARGLAPLTTAEREWAARAVYAAARRDWLEHEEPEPLEATEVKLV